MLKRFWIEFDSSYGDCLSDLGLGLGAGVTAFDLQDAIFLLKSALKVETLPTPDSVVENIIYDDLEQDHVRKNMGSMAIRGVWYPNFNL